jgi:2,6-dihydroxypyridine 3-monooxygenase
MNEMARECLPPLIRDIVLSAPNPFVQVIYDIDVDRMAFGRICLLGDAGVVVRPHAAAGTAKAAADGWALDSALREHDSLDEALRAWEDQQLSLAKRLLDRTRRIGARSQSLNSWDPRDPEVIFGLYEPGN